MYRAERVLMTPMTISGMVDFIGEVHPIEDVWGKIPMKKMPSKGEVFIRFQKPLEKVNGNKHIFLHGG